MSPQLALPTRNQTDRLLASRRPPAGLRARLEREPSGPMRTERALPSATTHV